MEDMQSINVPPAGESALFLTTFGHSVTGPGHRYGPAGRSYHLIHFILAGKGTFQANQHTYCLHAGQGFLIEPDYQTTYESDAKEPWTYIWVAFNGSRAAEIIASLRLSQADPIYTCTKEQGAKLAAYVQDMLAHNSFTLSGRYYRLGLLMQFLSVLAEAQRDLLPPADNNAYISHMTNFIRTHLEEPFTVQELADEVLTRYPDAGLPMSPQGLGRYFNNLWPDLKYHGIKHGIVRGAKHRTHTLARK